MQTPILQESNYKEEMQTIVEPYLVSIGTEFYLERHAGQKIHCMHYVPENPHAVVMLSHGFIENAEKYKEIAYYFAKEGFSVYLPEHCGHGFSYRLTEDESLVHLDSFERYVEDFIFVTKKAKEDNPGMKIYLYGHSMGGGIAAAVAARAPEGNSVVTDDPPTDRRGAVACGKGDRKDILQGGKEQKICSRSEAIQGARKI